MEPRRLAGLAFSALKGQAKFLPFSQAAVEDFDALVPVVAQQPPEAAGPLPDLVVVGDDARLVVDAVVLAPRDEVVRLRERVAAARSVPDRAGEVAVDVRVDGAGDVGLRKRARTEAPVGQVVAAVDEQVR